MTAAAHRSDLGRTLEDGVAGGVCTGAVLWVARDGVVVHESAAGRLDDGAGAPEANLHTVFDLASLTKPMATATLLMGLAAEGRIAPTDPVAARLPGFAAGPDGARRRRVTVAHLLSHAAGLPDWRPYFEGVRLGDRDGVVALALEEPLEAAPGERTLYSDIGYILLGEIVQRIGGAPMERLFAERVAGPLGLSATTFNPGNRPDPPFIERVAASGTCPRRGPLRGVVHDDNAYAMGGVSGHAGLFGTAADVGRWALALLDAWHGRHSPLPGTVVRRFLAREGGPGARGGWVLGFCVPTPPSSAGRHFGPDAVGHLGFTGTSVWIDLGREWVVVLLTNRVHTDPDGSRIKRFRPLVHDRVARALLDA